MIKEKKWLKKNTIAIQTAASRLKIKTEALRYQIECENIESRDSRIHKLDFEIIQMLTSQIYRTQSIIPPFFDI